MIHSVAVTGGDSNTANIAQRHAIRMANLFEAKLRVVVTWNARNVEETMDAGAPANILQALVDEELATVSAEPGASRLRVERSVNGDGLIKGTLDAASESDLLVIGLADADSVSLLRKADCMILAVHRAPETFRRILVDYQGGLEGKAALRLAGEVASRAGAAVTVLCVAGDAAVAGALAATAVRYLEPYGLVAVGTIEHQGSSTSQHEAFLAVKDVDADLVVVARERHGFFTELFDQATMNPENLAEEMSIPVLIAR
jgi:nucleotide-binding universal stress UspA family protein